MAQTDNIGLSKMLPPLPERMRTNMRVRNTLWDRAAYYGT